jgi:hypothetical protein
VALNQNNNNEILRLFKGSKVWHMTVAAKKPWQVEKALYMTKEGRIAWGYTNHTKDQNNNDIWFILLDTDTKEMEFEAWLRALVHHGFKPVIALETRNGYHAVTANYTYNMQEIATYLQMLADWKLVDSGTAKLAEIRARDQIPFTNILRVNGKYKEKDIIVRRWLPPPTPWHAKILELYAKHCTLQISATRIAHGCTGYLGRPGPSAEAGQEIHEAWEKEMHEAGWNTEVTVEHRIGNMKFTARVDALRLYSDMVELIELKSTRITAKSYTSWRQLKAETALTALHFGKQAWGYIKTPDAETHAYIRMTPSEALRTLYELYSGMFFSPTCESCIFKEFCIEWNLNIKKWLDTWQRDLAQGNINRQGNR